jgi:hypothetical protein
MHNHLRVGQALGGQGVQARPSLGETHTHTRTHAHTHARTHAHTHTYTHTTTTTCRWSRHWEAKESKHAPLWGDHKAPIAAGKSSCTACWVAYTALEAYAGTEDTRVVSSIREPSYTHKAAATTTADMCGKKGRWEGARAAFGSWNGEWKRSSVCSWGNVLLLLYMLW